METEASLIRDVFIQEYGVYLRTIWIQTCLDYIKQKSQGNEFNQWKTQLTSGYKQKKDSDLFKHVFYQFLHADLNEIGEGYPLNQLAKNSSSIKDFGQLHEVTIPGPYTIQIDELVNISRSISDHILSQKEKNYYSEAQEQKSGEEGEEGENQENEQTQVASEELKKAQQMLKSEMDKFEVEKKTREFLSSRVLKLSCTDGSNRSFAMEYRFIPSLSLQTPPGTKICVRQAEVKRGLLMLVPGVVRVLGGGVDSLIEKHKKYEADLQTKLLGG